MYVPGSFFVHTHCDRHTPISDSCLIYKYYPFPHQAIFAEKDGCSIVSIGVWNGDTPCFNVWRKFRIFRLAVKFSKNNL